MAHFVRSLKSRPIPNQSRQSGCANGLCFVFTHSLVFRRSINSLVRVATRSTRSGEPRCRSISSTSRRANHRAIRIAPDFLDLLVRRNAKADSDGQIRVCCARVRRSLARPATSVRARLSHLFEQPHTQTRWNTSAINSMRSSVEVGATRKIVSMPAARIWATNASASSGIKSVINTPSTPAAFKAFAHLVSRQTATAD